MFGCISLQVGKAMFYPSHKICVCGDAPATPLGHMSGPITSHVPEYYFAATQMLSMHAVCTVQCDDSTLTVPQP